MHEVLGKLLKSNPSEESLEGLCRLADWSSDQQEIFCNLIILKVVDNGRTGPGEEDQREAQHGSSSGRVWSQLLFWGYFLSVKEEYDYKEYFVGNENIGEGEEDLCQGEDPAPGCDRVEAE